MTTPRRKEAALPRSIEMRSTGDESAEILIYDRIGSGLFQDGVTAKQFAGDLKALGPLKVLDVRINSPGGAVFEGLAIYNTLKRQKATVRVHIDGAALSIASAIAMAGDEIEMASEGLMMLHNATAVAAGDEGEMLRTAEMLKKVTENVAGIYADKSGLPREQVAALMAEETWFTADEALAKNLITAVSQTKAVTNSFDLSQFKNPPAALRQPVNHAEPVEEKPMSATAPETKPAEVAPAEAKPADVRAPEQGASGPPDLAKLQADAETAALKRIEDVSAMCSTAGVPAMAAGFVRAGLSVRQVEALLPSVVSASNAGRDPLQADTSGTDAGKSPDAKYETAFTDAEPVCRAMGVSKDQYIRTLKINDGAESLVAAK